MLAQAIFGEKAFLRPNKGDTFPLEGLGSKLIAVWQDWRLDLTPVPWDTLLLLLEGESVPAAAKGLPAEIVHNPPPFVITTQFKVEPRDQRGVPDERERLAFKNRFGLRWHLRGSIPKEHQDPTIKLCYQCRGCYARWVERNEAEYLSRDDEAISEGEKQTAEIEAALIAQHGRQAETKRSRLFGPPAGAVPPQAAAPATPTAAAPDLRVPHTPSPSHPLPATPTAAAPDLRVPHTPSPSHPLPARGWVPTTPPTSPPHMWGNPASDWHDPAGSWQQGWWTDSSGGWSRQGWSSSSSGGTGWSSSDSGGRDWSQRGGDGWAGSSGDWQPWWHSGWGGRR